MHRLRPSSCDNTNNYFACAIKILACQRPLSGSWPVRPPALASLHIQVTTATVNQVCHDVVNSELISLGIRVGGT